MTFQTLGAGCTGKPNGCFGFRGIVGTCNDPANDGVNANMLAYLNAYDLTTVPWGYLRSVTFSLIGLAAPDNLGLGGMPLDIGFGGYTAFSQWFVIDGSGNPFIDATGARTQVYWPGGSAFGVWCEDSWNALQTAYCACTGIMSPCEGKHYRNPHPEQQPARRHALEPLPFRGRTGPDSR